MTARTYKLILQISQLRVKSVTLYKIYILWPQCRVGVNSAPELDFLANSKSNSGIELDLALPSPGRIGIELEFNKI